MFRRRSRAIVDKFGFHKDCVCKKGDKQMGITRLTYSAEG